MSNSADYKAGLVNLRNKEYPVSILTTYDLGYLITKNENIKLTEIQTRFENSILADCCEELEDILT